VAPFEPSGTYSKFSAYALLHHGGDFRAAAQTLFNLGYGTRREEKKGTGKAGEPDPAAGLATTPLTEIQPVPVHLLVEGLIPLGKLTLLAGGGGHGKTTLTLEIAAGVSKGRAVLGIGYARPAAGEVLLISCEDDFGDTVMPRLLALDADLSKIHRVDGVPTKKGKPAPFSLAHYESVKG
jgi:hypothetical protein